MSDELRLPRASRATAKVFGVKDLYLDTKNGSKEPHGGAFARLDNFTSGNQSRGDSEGKDEAASAVDLLSEDCLR
jgi:hypothetical protein